MVFMTQFGTIPTSNAVNKMLRQLLDELGIQRKIFTSIVCVTATLPYFLLKVWIYIQSANGLVIVIFEQQ